MIINLKFWTEFLKNDFRSCQVGWIKVLYDEYMEEYEFDDPETTAILIHMAKPILDKNFFETGRLVLELKNVDFSNDLLHCFNLDGC